MNIQILKNEIENDPVLNNIANFFDNSVYLVGGAVRDILMGKSNILDRDLIVTDEDARDFSLKISEFFKGKYIPLDEENKIYRVVLKDKQNFIDITNPLEGNIQKDLMRRDLRINAIAVNIKTGDIIDPVNGLADITNRVLNSIKEENFTDDPLRLLRIFRFHSVTGFDISDDLMHISKKYAYLIEKPARERVEYELIKLFEGKYADSALLKLDEATILEYVFPFVKELKQVPSNAHHHLDLFHHSVETVRQLELLYDKADLKVIKHLNNVDFGGGTRLAHLKLACFMHDIGKFSTWTIEDITGRHRFIKHDEQGAKMCSEILKKLSFSNKQIDYIKFIIKNHMYASMVMSSPDISEKSMMRYIRKTAENAIDAIMIAKADRLSALGPEITDKIVQDNLHSLDKLLNFYLQKQEEIKPLPKLLNGNEVMNILGINPSPKLGEIIDALYEAQISGDVISREDAIDFIKKL